MSAKISLFCASLLLTAAVGCHHQHSVAVPSASATPPTPPPAPPKCEALQENCVATDATALAIGAQGATIKPPAGWKYAKEAERSIAVSAEGKSLLSAVEIGSADEAAIIDSLEKQMLAAGVEKVKSDTLKKRLKKPQNTVPAGANQVELWEVSKATNNGSPELREEGVGTALVFVAKLAPNRVVTGLGFVVVPEAEADAEKVMQALQSLKGSP